jgi:hypothetical protein
MQRVRTALRTRPEFDAIIGDLIGREGVEQLTDAVVVVILPQHARPLDTRLRRLGLIVDKCLLDRLENLQLQKAHNNETCLTQHTDTSTLSGGPYSSVVYLEEYAKKYSFKGQHTTLYYPINLLVALKPVNFLLAGPIK